jgi:hypothetical protein
MPRKYRQRGYQDDSPDIVFPKREEKRERGPRQGYGPREPRKINMPGFRDVQKCSRCGEIISGPIAVDSRCLSCSSDLHSCAQCTWFDTGSRFECSQPIPARVSPKDARNSCTSYETRVTVERETRETRSTSPSAEKSDDGGARRAFDDLFK